MKKRVLSGIQPSGDFHLGNYFGAIRQWVEMQEEYECYYFLATYHTLTTLHNGDELRRLNREALLTALACGVDPERSVIFEQHHDHLELAWILGCVAPMGLLERAHAYKDKVAKGISPSVGLFTYPVLMAADILLYDPDLVPVGQDQKQHVEITRDLADKFNAIFGGVFHLPDPYIPPEAAVVSGTDGQKMSKSYGNTIPLFASDEELKKLVMGIVTDSAGVADKKEPKGNTIYELYKLVATADEAKLMADKFRDGGYGYGEAKKELLRVLQAFLLPFREKRNAILAEKDYLDEVLEAGNAKARKVSRIKMDVIRRVTGLL